MSTPCTEEEAHGAIGLSAGVPSRLPNAVLGTLLFLATEVMFFAGLISAFVVVRARFLTGWPPPGQPRLPVEVTAVNTLVLLVSGLVLLHAGRLAEGHSRNYARARRLGLLAAALGTVFVVVQGVEWVRLLGYGLGMRSGPYGSFFYLIVGAHALHAVAAIVALLAVTWRADPGGWNAAAHARYRAVRYFWYFVVGVWPVLYVLVYLGS